MALVLGSCGELEGWPAAGRDGSRNAVTSEKNPPMAWSMAKGKERNIAWSAQLGNYTLASPVVEGGLVWVSTDGIASAGLAGKKEDVGSLLCFREEDGALLWRRDTPSRKELPVEARGLFPTLRGSPLALGDRLFILDNRWEVVSLDIGPLKRGTGEPREIWKTDLIATAHVQPEIPGMGFSQGCSIGPPHAGMLYVSTGNGPSWSSGKVERPDAPALVCLSAETGALLAEEASGISRRSVIGNRSSPVTTESDGPDGHRRTLVLFGGGDGMLYAFDAEPAPGPDHGRKVLRERWRADCNRANSEKSHRGAGIVASPVVAEGRAYALLGQDSWDNGAEGALTCVDVASGRKLWSTEEIGLSVSPPVIKDRLVYVLDGQGFVRCLEAATGKLVWTFDTLSSIATPPLIADGFLYVATTDPEMLIFDVRFGSAGGERGTRKPIAIRPLPSCLYAGPVFVGGRLFLALEKSLFAIHETTQGNVGERHVTLTRGAAPDALFIPTSRDLIPRIMELAAVQSTDVFYDLGSGDGRLLISAAKNQGCRAVGFEVNRELVDQSREAIRKAGVQSKAAVMNEDLLKANLEEATVIFLYIGERLNGQLLPKLRALPNGVRIVSHDFHLPGIIAEHVQRIDSSEDGRDHALYLYRTPLRLK